MCRLSLIIKVANVLPFLAGPFIRMFSVGRSLNESAAFKLRRPFAIVKTCYVPILQYYKGNHFILQQY